MLRIHSPTYQIPDIVKLAVEQAERVATLRRELPLRCKRIGNLFYTEAKGGSSGTIANLIVEVCDAKVGVGYSTDEQKQITDVSMRCAATSRIDLGKQASKLAKRFGGFGAGHKNASGARIPTSKFMEFMWALGKKTDEHGTQTN